VQNDKHAMQTTQNIASKREIMNNMTVVLRCETLCKNCPNDIILKTFQGHEQPLRRGKGAASSPNEVHSRPAVTHNESGSISYLAKTAVIRQVSALINNTVQGVQKPHQVRPWQYKLDMASGIRQYGLYCTAVAV